MEHNTIVIDSVTGKITTEFQEQPIIDDVIRIDYKSRVEELIKLRYSLDDEAAIQRKFILDKISHEIEFMEYYNYTEQCKSQARLECGL